MYGYIYLTTNLINDKKYLGQKMGSFNSNYLGSGKILKQSIKLHGKENFKVEVVKYANTKDELNKLEIYYIEKYNAANSNDFYNIHEGGNGGNTKAGYSEEQMNRFCNKVSEAKKGLKLNLSKEQIEKKSKRFSGENNPMYGKVSAMKGKKHSIESKIKMGNSNKGKNLGKKHSEEQKKKISSGLEKHYSDLNNRKKCSRKNEENGMATPSKIIFPWGEEKEFTMLKTLYQYLKEEHDLNFTKSQAIYLSKQPWENILLKRHRYLKGLKILNINNTGV